MTHWHNFGVKVSDTMTREKVASILKQHGFTVWKNGEDEVKGGKSNDINLPEIESDLSIYSDEIESVVIVRANDTDDSATGEAYEFKGGNLVKEDYEHSGGENTRSTWIGLRHNGLKMNGKKYF